MAQSSSQNTPTFPPDLRSIRVNVGLKGGVGEPWFGVRRCLVGVGKPTPVVVAPVVLGWRVVVRR